MKIFYAVSVLITLLFFTPAKSQNWIPDSLFGNNSIFTVNAGGSEVFSDFLFQSDGNIIAGGFDSEASGHYNNIMIRFDRCGIIDSTFGTNGIVNHRFDQRNKGYNYSLQTDGKFLCAGIQAPGNAGSQQIPFVARYNSNGSVDTNFANAGTKALRFDALSSGTFYSVIPMSDGRILCGGTSSANANGGVHGLGAMRFLNDGSLDSTFDYDGKTRYAINTSYKPARAKLLQNGNIVVAGRYIDIGSNTRFVAVCFDSTGTLDTNFASAGLFTDTVNLKYNYADAYMDIQPDEKIIMACTREPVTSGIEVIRFSPTGSPDISFGNNGHVNLTFAGMECTGIQVMPSGRIMVLGNTGSDGSAVQLLPNGEIDSAFASNGYLLVNFNPNGSDWAGGAIELPNNRLLFGGGGSNHYMKRFAITSNVPHITGNIFLLQTTGAGTFQWFLNDTAITGATNSTWIPLANGNYSVEITDDLGCKYRSSIFPVNGVSIEEFYSSDLISVYPNPVRSDLFISSTQALTQVKLIDIMGKEIFKKKITDQSINFNFQISSYAPGVYFLETTTSWSKVHTKIIKQ